MTRGQHDKIGLGKKKKLWARSSSLELRLHLSVTLIQSCLLMDTFSFPYRHHAHFDFHFFPLMGCNVCRNNHLFIAY